MNIPAKLRSLPDLVDEYDAKLAAIPDALQAYREAGEALIRGATIGGEYGGEYIDTSGRGTEEKTLERNLRRSVWSHVWNGLNLPIIASARDKKKWEQSLSDPPPFTLDNLRTTLGPYLENPRATILRGMAEVFADLDPAYKSHEKVKIGVKGLPKRIILTGYGRAQISDVLNALAAYQGKPLHTHVELAVLKQNGDAMRDGGEYPDPYQNMYERDRSPKTVSVLGRGVWLKSFQNGNDHLFFGPEALSDINMALAEFYGEVLADCYDDDEARPDRRKSTAVSKDLQFYPTPIAVIDRVIRDFDLRGKLVLEPSCGDGRFMDAIRDAGASVVGCEIDKDRAAECVAKGHNVMKMNFLETVPDPKFDVVIMNPPFYGKHYEKHVRHALRFLNDGGTLVSILPATARYDHGLLDDLSPRWIDLPVGSFCESGTNICTVTATITKRKLK